jgi:hypothetical protein
MGMIGIVGILCFIASLGLGLAFLISRKPETRKSLKKSFLWFLLLGLCMIIVCAVYIYIEISHRVMNRDLPPMKYENARLEDVLRDISKMQRVRFWLYERDLCDSKISFETTEKTSVKKVLSIITSQAQCKYKSGDYCGTCGGMITPIEIYKDGNVRMKRDCIISISDGEVKLMR